MQKFHDRRVVDTKKPHDLSYEQYRKRLSYLIFLKLRNDEVKIKGREGADGIKQWNWISKEDASSPTISTEGLILSCMIDV